MSDIETIAGVQRVAACQHHDSDAGSLFACGGKLVVDNLAAGGEREPQVTIGDASDVDRHLGASRNSEEAREAVDHRRRGQDLGSKVGELLDDAGRGQ
jgi:hypothetical protein